MSILIKGMEMPKSCFYCPFRLKVDPDTIVCLATNEHIEETFAGTIEMRNSGKCPLAPIPAHGRLIDADALAAQCDDPYWCVWRSDIEAAPTIIPAELCEEKGE